jgi:hypothetical protein
MQPQNYYLFNLVSQKTLPVEFYAEESPTYSGAIRYLETLLRNGQLPTGQWTVIVAVIA